MLTNPSPQTAENEPVTIGVRQPRAENDEDDKILIRVVIERALELGYNQRPEPTLP